MLGVCGGILTEYQDAHLSTPVFLLTMGHRGTYRDLRAKARHGAPSQGKNVPPTADLQSQQISSLLVFGCHGQKTEDKRLRPRF